MKKTLIIIALVAVGIGLIIWFITRPSNDAVVQQPPVEFPTGGIASSSGSTFLQNPNISEDANNPGNYFIGNQPGTEVGNRPYLITYTAETKYFNITLTQEPIGQARKNAEAYLMETLSLTEDQMCGLDYTVYTPTTVNNQYAGTNLGFSFCPGAVKLP